VPEWEWERGGGGGENTECKCSQMFNSSCSKKLGNLIMITSMFGLREVLGSLSARSLHFWIACDKCNILYTDLRFSHFHCCLMFKEFITCLFSHACPIIIYSPFFTSAPNYSLVALNISFIRLVSSRTRQRGYINPWICSQTSLLSWMHTEMLYHYSNYLISRNICWFIIHTNVS